MGFLDKLKEMAGKHSDKTERGVDRAATMADERTGGRYGEHIETGSEKVKDTLRDRERGDRPPS